MERNKILELLRLEASIGRTTGGWPLKGRAKECLEKTLIGEEDRQFAKCKNCGFVASGGFFYAGCLNCNAKDIDVF